MSKQRQTHWIIQWPTEGKPLMLQNMTMPRSPRQASTESGTLGYRREHCLGVAGRRVKLLANGGRRKGIETMCNVGSRAVLTIEMVVLALAIHEDHDRFEYTREQHVEMLAGLHLRSIVLELVRQQRLKLATDGTVLHSIDVSEILHSHFILHSIRLTCASGLRNRRPKNFFS